MSDPLPKFDAPPVIETVLGVQFSRLPGFSTAHAGWFWKSYLDASERWPKVVEAARLEDQTERFDEEVWGRPVVRLTAPGAAQRTQIIRADDERMMQIQDSRFILNWRKQSQGYPAYDVLVPEFRESFATFSRFVQDAGFGPLDPNQWEVTYLNHVPKGDMWDSPRDWPKILPGLYAPAAVGNEVRFETLSNEWRFMLKPQFARLYVDLKHVRNQSGEEMMMLQFTARGRIAPAEGFTWATGFDLGHEAIVRTFAAVTSVDAHKRWKRRG